MKSSIAAASALAACLAVASAPVQSQNRFALNFEGTCQRDGHPDSTAVLVLTMGLSGPEAGTLNGRGVEHLSISRSDAVNFDVPGTYKGAAVLRHFSGQVQLEGGKDVLRGILIQEDGKNAKCVLVSK